LSAVPRLHAKKVAHDFRYDLRIYIYIYNITCQIHVTDRVYKA
jgi:hypothetical protein